MTDRVLTTNWKRIGRSGPTVDGRVIEPKMIDDAAASYNKDLFTAMIWPEHYRWFNMGTVEQLKSVDNDEGGKDLFAILSPNSYYIEANKQGQKLFTSMELLPNFRKTDSWYLTGLGATDDPASVATSEVRLSSFASADGVFLSSKTEVVEREFTEQPKESFMSRLSAFMFKPNTDEEAAMAYTATLENLRKEMEELKASYAALKATGDKEAANKPTSLDEVFTKLDERINEIVDAKFAALPKDNELARAAIEAKLDELATKFSNALKEQPGTPAGEHHGSENELAGIY